MQPIHTEVSGRKLKLTNLDKILFPDHSIVKAEIIQYYLAVAPFILPFIKSRPLSFVRYPNGIKAHKFFQKDRPDWTPKWIKSLKMTESEDDKDYLMAEEEAALVWMAQMACLEIHCMQVNKHQPNQPDYFVFDLDPSNAEDFSQVKEIAFLLKDFLESKNYTPFIKTSGGKGAHIICPIIPDYELAEVVKSVKGLAQEFQSAHKSLTTLHIKKEARKGRMLLDIYRNHRSQTTVTILSTRGRPGAPVSMPISWDKLEDVKEANQFNISNALEYINKNGISWEDWRNYECILHTDKSKSKRISKESKTKQEKTNSKTFIDSESLMAYSEKRDFSKTTEPLPESDKSLADQFVIQLHDASTLHFDLRLQADGVLHSWAIPKGLPHKSGLKRLAIQTEAHPIKYLDFEGTIPANEYGAGEMWVFLRGEYESIIRTKKKWSFKLISDKHSASYCIYKMKGDQWLIELKESSSIDIFKNVPKPMRADVCKELPKKGEFSYEVKWDGIRAIIVIEDKKIRILSRSGKDLSDKFPELINDKDLLKTPAGIFDGEIVCLDDQGRPDFGSVISRMHSKGEKAIKSKSKSNPAFCYLFDMLFVGGRNIMKEPLFKRQQWLAAVLNAKGHFKISESFQEGKGLLEAAREKELEGIMVKNKNAVYEPGKRANHWRKLKFRNTDDFAIIGFTAGEGDRSSHFGALHLAQQEDDNWIYRGKVGSGFDVKKMTVILKLLQQKGEVKKYIIEKIEEQSKTVWINPGLVCEIQFASLTKNGTLREPVFIRMREDLYFN